MEILATILVLALACASCVLLYIPIIEFFESRVTKPYMMRLVCDKKNSYTIQVKLTRFSVWSDFYYIGKADLPVAMDIFREKLQTKFQKSGVICRQKIK